MASAIAAASTSVALSLPIARRGALLAGSGALSPRASLSPCSLIRCASQRPFLIASQTDGRELDHKLMRLNTSSTEFYADRASVASITSSKVADSTSCSMDGNGAGDKKPYVHEVLEDTLK